MDASHDDVFQADLILLREDRLLSEPATLRLARAVAGFGPSRNRDLPAHDLAASLLVLAKGLPDGARRREDEVLSIVLDPRKGPANVLAAVRDRACVAGGLPEAMPGLRRLAEALTFGAFLAMSEAGAGFGPFRDIVAALVGQPHTAGFVLCRRRLAAMADAYRRAHVPGTPTEPRMAALGRLLAERPGPPGEDLALDFFARLVADGERPLFAGTTAVVLTALGAREDAELRLTIGRAIPLEEATEAIADPHRTADDGPDFQALVAGLPVTPKLLNASERDRIAAILRFAPWHRRLPLSCLRAVAAGHWQMALVNTLKRSRGTADVEPLLSDPGALDYAGWLGGIDRVLERIADVGAMQMALAGPPDPADVRSQRLHVRGLSLLKAQTRAGFDRPTAELSRLLSEAVPALSALHQALVAFRRALQKRLGEQSLQAVEDHDRSLLGPLFRNLYRDKAEALP